MIYFTADLFSILYYLVHVAGWDGWICTMENLAQPLTTAGEELDDLDHDLSDLSEVGTISH